jgi:tRNA-2-methylthio-N6-dimethylallyladenosine synthase
MPDAAITTDIIVGFPGETEEDFQATIDVVRAARFAGAFTFQYSPRPGTPAATMPSQVPPDVVAERYERLVAVVEESAWAGNRELIGATLEVLVAEGEGRKDDHTQRLSGRARDNRLVHLAACDARPGDVVTAVVTHAAPHHLVADEVVAVRRTRGGDAWEAGPATGPASPGGVLLGMPGLRR